MADPLNIKMQALKNQPGVIEVVPPSPELLAMHKDICNAFAEHSVMLLVFGPYNKPDGNLPKVTMMLNDVQMFPFFLQVMILQHERMSGKPENEAQH